MPLGQNPGFKRKARSVRGESEEVLVLGDYTDDAVRLLPDDVAEYAALFVEVVLLGALQFFDHVDGKNRQGDELRVCVLQRGACCFAMVLENEDVLEPAIFLQVEDAITEGPQDILDALGRQRGQAGIVVWGLDNDLMRPDPVHLVEHTFGLAVQVSLNAKRWKFVGHDPDRPTWGITLRRWAAVRVGAVSLYFGWSLILVAVAEGAEATPNFHSLPNEIGGPLGAVG